jgi:hypothetical protein
MPSTRAFTACLFVLAAEAHAQIRTHSLCFRGRPLPACQSFVLLEPNGSERFLATRGIPLAGTSNTKDPYGFAAIDVGAMVNRPDRTAIGGTVHVGAEPGGRRRLALELRRRRWLTDRIAFDLGAGPLEINGRNSLVPFQPGAGYGVTSHAGLVLMDLATLTVGADLVQNRRTQFAPAVGARLGSWASVGTVLAATGLAALVGAALRD